MVRKLDKAQGTYYAAKPPSAKHRQMRHVAQRSGTRHTPHTQTRHTSGTGHAQGIDVQIRSAEHASDRAAKMRCARRPQTTPTINQR